MQLMVMRNWPVLAAVYFLVLASRPTYAAWVATELDAPKDGGPRISLQYLSTQYATDASLNTQSNSYQYVMPRLFAESDSKQMFQYKLDFNGLLPLSEAGESHYFFPSLYLGIKDRKRGLSAYFGRQREIWSLLDTQLSLGLWQPLFRWDHARPIQMGLTGFHFQSRQKYYQVKAMLSPFYLPDQQADFEVVDGQIISGNRWFRRPIHSIEVGNTDNTVIYNVNEPKAKDVIFNESYAFSARLGEKYGAFLSASWADKPMNQFHLGIDYEGGLTLDFDEINVQVEPVLVRHELITIESGYNLRDFRSFISYTTERFENPNFPEDWEETELIDSNYLGLGIQHLAPLPFLRNSALTWSFARRDLLEEDEKVTRIEGELDASTQRFPFENWFSLKWDAIKNLSNNKKLQSKITYSYSPSDDGDWVAADITLSVGPHWQWYVSADLFGADELEDAEDRSFISIYKNNDRVQGGFVYVF